MLLVIENEALQASGIFIKKFWRIRIFRISIFYTNLLALLGLFQQYLSVTVNHARNVSTKACCFRFSHTLLLKTVRTLWQVPFGPRGGKVSDLCRSSLQHTTCQCLRQYVLGEEEKNYEISLKNTCICKH